MMNRLPIGLAIAVAAFAFACSDSPREEELPPDQGQAKEIEMPTEGTASQAKLQLQEMEYVLNVTSTEQWADQMPVGFQPEFDRRGSLRFWRYTFEDGSQLEAIWRPRGGAGSGLGLVLDSVVVRGP